MCGAAVCGAALLGSERAEELRDVRGKKFTLIHRCEVAAAGHLGPVDDGVVKVPGWEKADIEATMKAAHDICPYSNLIRFAHEVELAAG